MTTEELETLCDTAYRVGVQDGVDEGRREGIALALGKLRKIIQELERGAYAPDPRPDDIAREGVVVPLHRK